MGLPPKGFPLSFKTYCFIEIEASLKRGFIDIRERFPDYIIDVEDIQSPSDSEAKMKVVNSILQVH